MKTIYDVNGNPAHYFENEKCKIVEAKDKSFHHIFIKENGFSMVYGKTKDEDPDFCSFGPLIADMEITTICKGPRIKTSEKNGLDIYKPCNFCYKGNTPNGSNMSFKTFKKVFDKLPKTVGQIAFGVDASATSNPDIWKIFEYCRKKGVVPNLTVSDINDETADKIASLAGACAVSVYDNKDICYDSVKKLTDRGMTQVNLHLCYHSGNYTRIPEIIEDIKNDPRLSKLNAIVFLALKQKGRGIGFTPLPFHKFKEMIEIVMESGISYGFDSCSCINFLKAVQDHPKYEQFKTMSEPCESVCFSSYIDVHGKFAPCSFCEGIVGWEEGLDVVNCKDFLQDIWNHSKTVDFRESLLANRRSCPVYNI